MAAQEISERREANLKDLQLCDLRDGLILHLIITSGEDEDVHTRRVYLTMYCTSIWKLIAVEHSVGISARLIIPKAIRAPLSRNDISVFQEIASCRHAGKQYLRGTCTTRCTELTFIVKHLAN